MNPEQVNEKLENYRASRARLEHLKMEAEELLRQIQIEAANAAANEAIRCQQYTGMPHPSGVNRSVEDAAIRYADGYSGQLARQWENERAEMLREVGVLERSVRYVDTWLSALEEKERVVVTNHIIDKVSWNELSAMSRSLFGYHMSVSGLRSIGREALRKIYDIAR